MSAPSYTATPQLAGLGHGGFLQYPEHSEPGSTCPRTIRGQCDCRICAEPLTLPRLTLSRLLSWTHSPEGCHTRHPGRIRVRRQHARPCFLMSDAQDLEEKNKHAVVQGNLQSSGRMRVPAGLHTVQMLGRPILRIQNCTLMFLTCLPAPSTEHDSTMSPFACT